MGDTFLALSHTYTQTDRQTHYTHVSDRQFCIGTNDNDDVQVQWRIQQAKASKQASVRACLLNQPVERSSDMVMMVMMMTTALLLSLSSTQMCYLYFFSSSDGRPVSAARLSCQRDGIELVIRASLQAGCKQNATYLWHLHQVVPLKQQTNDNKTINQSIHVHNNSSSSSFLLIQASFILVLLLHLLLCWVGAIDYY